MSDQVSELTASTPTDSSAQAAPPNPPAKPPSAPGDGGGGVSGTIPIGRSWISTLGAIVLGIGLVLLLIVCGLALRNQNNVVGLDTNAVATALRHALEEVPFAEKAVTDAQTTVTQRATQLKAAKTAANEAALKDDEKQKLDKAVVTAQSESDKAVDKAFTADINLESARVNVLVLQDRGKALSWWSAREADLAAIGFLFTMLGLLLLFPSLLSDGTKAIDGEIPLSTMRFAVLTVVILFVVITFRAAWVVGLDNLEVNSTWAWILAIAFGGKVGQSGIEWFAQRGGSGSGAMASGPLPGPAAPPPRP